MSQCLHSVSEFIVCVHWLDVSVYQYTYSCTLINHCSSHFLELNGGPQISRIKYLNHSEAVFNFRRALVLQFSSFQTGFKKPRIF